MSWTPLSKASTGAVSFPMERVRWLSSHTLRVPAPHPVGPPRGLPSVTEASEVKVALVPGEGRTAPSESAQPCWLVSSFIKWDRGGTC